MPYQSKKQERTMKAVAHNPKFAKKVGIPAEVAKKFVKDAAPKKGLLG